MSGVEGFREGKGQKQTLDRPFGKPVGEGFRKHDLDARLHLNMTPSKDIQRKSIKICVDNILWRTQQGVSWVEVVRMEAIFTVRMGGWAKPGFSLHAHSIGLFLKNMDIISKLQTDAAGYGWGHFLASFIIQLRRQNITQIEGLWKDSCVDNFTSELVWRYL